VRANKYVLKSEIMRMIGVNEEKDKKGKTEMLKKELVDDKARAGNPIDLYYSSTIMPG